ncbi:HAD-IA family hydrolase [Alterisphingorhabdus coralli]|uniref:phosphoglycolate phosphatase n=1 Tax=Alterisphingorhabdus coralli TaxID=3071408 RepID=A0AA97F4T0_9SPHN|nr:HAD-IA family hydrolase [Parasphingorhabdus sp. SCSIO 66989]WOE74231.1 HAD-IA family hydrolase [Parasphingorhabdus sp. SCSIO 66989]
MPEISFQIVAFDLDGTLLDTSPELTAAVNHTLAIAGCPPLAIDDVKPMVGLGAKHMLTEGLTKAGIDDPEATKKYLPELLNYYGKNLGSGSPPYPGLLKVMDTLDDMGIAMAVVTNKFERFAETLLTRINMRDRFAAVIGGDTMGKGKAKPHRAPIDEMIKRSGGGKAIFIGDSIYDVMAAHNAGIPAIAVRFGFLHQPVDELGADAILDHYDDLLGLLAEMSD